jgi:flagellar hook-length control protein FliK
MAKIANVLTQDGQAAVIQAADAAGGEPGAEFLALLATATGALPQPALAAPADDDPTPVDDMGGVLTGGLAALVAAADPKRTPANGAEVAHPAAGRAAAATGLPHRLPVPLPAADASPDAGAPLDGTESGNKPAVTLPSNASPVAVAVLHALEAGQRPTPHAAVLPHASPAVTDPVPVSAVVTQLADAVTEIVGSDAGTQAGPDGDGAQGGAAAQAMPGAPVVRDAAVGAAHLRSLPGTVGSPAWRHALGTEVRLMIERGVGAATLRLSPEHLGPVEVRIDFADDGANVWFAASHADTRAALAEALPRLRDMLASVGVNLGEAGVQRDLPGEAGRRDGAWREAGPSATDLVAESRAVVTRLDAGRGMVDEYA